MNHAKTIDPVLDELVREIARAPRSRILGTRVHEPGPPPALSQAEKELLRVYRTQAAELWCDAALDCLMKSKVGTELLFVAPSSRIPPIDNERIKQESRVLPPISPLNMLVEFYSSNASSPQIAPEVALQMARTSNDLFPSARALMVASDVQLYRNKLDQAEALCRRGLRITLKNSQRAQFHERLGSIARRRGKARNFLNHLAIATGMDHSNITLFWSRLRASLELGDRLESIKASEALEKATDQMPLDARGLYRALERQRQLRQTSAAFTLVPTFESVRTLLGMSSRGLIDAFA
jgi:hypothetical protein